MEPFRAYLPEALDRMTTVLARATQELDLSGSPASERERLAACILSVGNSYDDINRLLEKSVRLYLRGRASTISTRGQAPELPGFL